MKSYLILSLLYFVACTCFSAVKTEVDRTDIASDETLTLVISSQDHLSLSPDLSPLKKDFTIVGTSQNSQVNLINGSMKMETQWQIALLPKHPGEITIPALQVGKDVTVPQVIHVRAMGITPTDQTAATNSQDIFIESTITPKETYIHEQMAYRLKVYLRRAVENPYLMGPELSDAKITQTGQDIVYNAVKSGKTYRVVERNYVITPRRAGQFTIDPPMLKGYLDGGRDFLDAYGIAGPPMKPIQVKGPTLHIVVKPKPANFVGPWLPARKLTLTETWAPNPPHFRVGEPITRIVEVTAEGVAVDRIPSLTVPESKNLNSYPEQPTRDAGSQQGVEVGKLTQKITFIPTSTGNVTLPEIKLPWWNTMLNRKQIAILPAKKVWVSPGSLSSPVSSKTASATTTPPAQKTLTVSQHKDRSFWPFLALFFSLAWLITLFLWRKQNKRGQIKLKGRRHNTTLQAQLKKACLVNDAKKAREILLTWAEGYWSGQPCHSLADIVHIIEQEADTSEFIAKIMQLEAVFYSNHQLSWEGSTLWHAMQSYLQEKEAKAKQPNEDPLPPLYCGDMTIKEAYDFSKARKNP